jgi:hypothetical protein
MNQPDFPPAFSNIRTITSAKVWSLLILFTFLGISLLNLRTWHPWGDDFAQYISQALNLASGKSQLDTGLIHTPYTIEWQAPRYYPFGLPLFLTPAAKLFGNHLLSFNYSLAVVYFILCISLFLYFKQQFSPLTSLLLTLTLCLNPWMVYTKFAILSDIPYLAFSTLALYFLQKNTKSRRDYIFTFISLYFSFSLRSISITLLAAIIFFSIFELIKNHHSKGARINLTMTVLAFIAYQLSNRLLFNLPPTNSYLQIFGVTSLSQFTSLLLYSPSQFLLAFRDLCLTLTSIIYLPPFLAQGKLLLTLIWLGICFAGFLVSSYRSLSLSSFYLICYLSVLFLTRIGNGQGFRILLPILPILFYYTFDLIQLLTPKLKPFVIILLLLIVTSYLPLIFQIQNTKDIITDGPQTPSAQEAFDFIRQSTPISANIVFYKARALALYTQRHTHPIINRPLDSQPQINFLVNQYHQLHINYFLIDYQSDDFENKLLLSFINHDQTAKEIWHNHQYRLYRY